jgi:hypothetical protein
LSAFGSTLEFFFVKILIISQCFTQELQLSHYPRNISLRILKKILGNF